MCFESFIDKSCNSANQDISWSYGDKRIKTNGVPEGFLRQ